jgi:DNA-binding SARP family transcriptional activator
VGGEASLERREVVDPMPETGSSMPGASAFEFPAGALFEAFPYGLAVARPDGRMLRLNRRARSLLLADASAPPDRWSCCELICEQAGPLLGTDCLTRMALTGSSDLPEIRIDVGGERLPSAAWVTASMLGSEEVVLFHLRPGRPGDRRRRTRQGWHGDSRGGVRAELRIVTLGSFSLETAQGPIVGEWLTRRPGELLKLLLARRRRLMCPDQIVDALWPEAGNEDGKNRLRYQVHALRKELDPGRSRHEEARFIRSRQGGYVFDTSVVWIDADEFEREAQAGLTALRNEDPASARPHLARAAALYKGSFLPDDPYAEWALEERERLHELAVGVLHGRAQALERLDDLDGAIASAKRLAELEPYDGDVQQTLLGLLLKDGRRGEVLRRYESYRRRVEKEFGAPPDFDPRSLGEASRRES